MEQAIAITPVKEDPRQCWKTPKQFIEYTNETFGPFHLDVCADAHNAQCGHYFGAPGYKPPESYAQNKVWLGADAFQQPWIIDGLSRVNCWCNPGFSDVWPWMEKAQAEAEENNAHTFLLIHAATSTEWFDHFIDVAHRIWAPRPRINFIPKAPIKASSNARESLLFEFRRDAQPDGMIHVLKPWKPMATRERVRRGVIELAS